MNTQVSVLKEFAVENLEVQVFDRRAQMGVAAGQAVAHRIRGLLQKQNSVNIIFAAAPSQNEFLATLAKAPDIDWSRVVAFQMDEYVGLPAVSTQLFKHYLDRNLFQLIDIGKVHYLNSAAASTEDECARYAQLLLDSPIDIVCCGIGENGHLAFNDPPVADFFDVSIAKTVVLEQACRQQQVNDGCFPSLDSVPSQAITLTIPALLSARYIYCVVPAASKSDAVYKTLFGPISTDCPASILRRHFRSALYLDKASATRVL